MKIKTNILPYNGVFRCLCAVALNIILLYLVFFICRIEYLLENLGTLGGALSSTPPGRLLEGILLFDTSGVFYTVSFYALLMLIPIHFKESGLWQKVCRIVFIATGAVTSAADLIDSVYFDFTGRRSTWSVLSEFSSEDNLPLILLKETANHWYLVVLWAAIVLLLIRFTVTLKGAPRPRGFKSYAAYYIAAALSLAIFAGAAYGGIRGGVSHSTRPITISNATQFVNRPSDAALVLNTPFSMLRTISNNSFSDPHYMSQEEVDGLYSAVHSGDPESPMIRKNVVIFILESFGSEYIPDYSPFLKSIIDRSTTFEMSFSNGRKSIDAMPSVLSSIPMFIEPFILTPSSMNRLGGIARELGTQGYDSGFFHGAQNSSMGFQAFANATGFKRYYGRTEFDKDPRFPGDAAFDGMWAIWDEEFLQFFALKMNELQEPFFSAVFTASSHHPFAVPERYRDNFPEEGDNPMYRCVRYTDYSLKLFFETAASQPWFENTVFVLVADHTNQSSDPHYQTALGYYSVPVIFYDPSGQVFTPGKKAGITQQIDIMPTLLSALHYPGEYVAFGKDSMASDERNDWAVNYNNGVYQYVEGDYLLLFDTESVKGLYDLRSDWALQHDLSSDLPELRESMLQRLKAIIQEYMVRMVTDRLMVELE